MAPDGQLRSRNRTALLGVYAALDTTGKLANALRQLGVEFDGPLEPFEQLLTAAADLDQQDPPIPRLQVARALTDVLNQRGTPRRGQALDQLLQVVTLLVDPSRRDTDTEGVSNLFGEASGAARFEDRWALLNRARENSPLHKDLRVIEHPQIGTSLHAVAGEIATRIETNFVVNLEGPEEPDLQKIARALLPDNWPVCGDFFCELSRKEGEERDRDVVGATGGDLSVGTSHWRGVYLERVGGCPDGWFPQTFLLFTWDRYRDRLILRYELVPRRPNDRTVLRIDEGYIQVNRLHDAYEVSTLKYLLFDDKFISGGGQALAAAAPQMGWLDYSINQFGSCAEEKLPPVKGIVGPGSSGPEGIDAGFQRILGRCETHLQESATSADAQFQRIMCKVNEGKYGLNDFVGDWGEATLRAMRDTSRVVLNQIDLATESLQLAKIFAGRKASGRDQ